MKPLVVDNLAKHCSGSQLLFLRSRMSTFKQTWWEGTKVLRKIEILTPGQTQTAENDCVIRSELYCYSSKPSQILILPNNPVTMETDQLFVMTLVFIAIGLVCDEQAQWSQWLTAWRPSQGSKVNETQVTSPGLTINSFIIFGWWLVNVKPRVSLLSLTQILVH